MPITAPIILNSWLFVLSHHVYISDALQVASAKEGSDLLVSGDDKLVEIANSEGLTAINVEKEQERLFDLFKVD